MPPVAADGRAGARQGSATNRRVASARSTLSTPTPARPITLSFLPAAMTSFVTVVPLERRRGDAGRAVRVWEEAGQARSRGVRAGWRLRMLRLNKATAKCAHVAALCNKPANNKAVVLANHADELCRLGRLIQSHKLMLALLQNFAANLLDRVRCEDTCLGGRARAEIPRKGALDAAEQGGGGWGKSRPADKERRRKRRTI